MVTNILCIISYNKYSLEGLILKLNFQHCGRLMQRADSLEKTLMLVIAYNERCQIHDHQKKMIYLRDQGPGWITQSFCVAEVFVCLFVCFLFVVDFVIH